MSEAIPAQKQPYGVRVEAGQEYWWCACGRSKTQPFCDGSHQGTRLRPVMHIAQQSEELWFCGCKATKSAPFCDGSHNAL
jgi:CDGSH-type Zn-finger protein